MDEQAVSVETLARDSFMHLWQSYCDKKMEVEKLLASNLAFINANKSLADKATEDAEAIEHLAALLGWTYGKCMAFGLHNSSNADTILKMDEIKLCLSNLRVTDSAKGDGQ